ncbi:XRE family transcriptional regulator [Jatrophihabitans telluris]|uniref:XRE family transcriptional regulator n=1 Tax=Jatrophihabitans telluris TaxID=2038343 RepID=A0ABY4R265_9ACTN|nr:XRE family transcriptional regulator [Jatrophihabitans telluris]UQX90018.1 XRE family transcriptional regulator [Jatrophihabitans telluris]
MWNDTGMVHHGKGELSTEGPTPAATIGRRIRQLRSARGWSLSHVAAAAGLGKATLSEIEAGRRNPTLETLYAIAAQLGVGLADLLREPGEQPPTPRVYGAAVSAVLIDVYDDPTVTTEIYRLTVTPGVQQVSPGHGAGVTEQLLVTAGQLRAGPLGDQVEVSAGQNAKWESSGEHGYLAIGEDPVEAVLIIRHPREF